MSVCRHINRYRTIPSGYDFLEVLKKGKAFHRTSVLKWSLLKRQRGHGGAQKIPRFQRLNRTREQKDTNSTKSIKGGKK